MVKIGSKMFQEVTDTWNPITGCLHGCIYCWARRYAERLSKMGVQPYASRGFQPTFIEELKISLRDYP